MGFSVMTQSSSLKSANRSMPPVVNLAESSTAYTLWAALIMQCFTRPSSELEVTSPTSFRTPLEQMKALSASI